MSEERKCKDHPDAPHGFDRTASHNEGRYVCECDYWEPPVSDLKDMPVVTVEQIVRFRNEAIATVEALQAKVAHLVEATDVSHSLVAENYLLRQEIESLRAKVAEQKELYDELTQVIEKNELEHDEYVVAQLQHVINERDELRAKVDDLDEANGTLTHSSEGQDYSAISAIGVLKENNELRAMLREIVEAWNSDGNEWDSTRFEAYITKAEGLIK
jgi:hypothetical protein